MESTRTRIPCGPRPNDHPRKPQQSGIHDLPVDVTDGFSRISPNGVYCTGLPSSASTPLLVPPSESGILLESEKQTHGIKSPVGKPDFLETFLDCRLRYIRQTRRLQKYLRITPEGRLILNAPKQPLGPRLAYPTSHRLDEIVEKDIKSNSEARDTMPDTRCAYENNYNIISPTIVAQSESPAEITESSSMLAGRASCKWRPDRYESGKREDADQLARFFSANRIRRIYSVFRTGHQTPATETQFKQTLDQRTVCIGDSDESHSTDWLSKTTSHTIFRENRDYEKSDTPINYQVYKPPLQVSAFHALTKSTLNDDGGLAERPMVVFCSPLCSLCQFMSPNRHMLDGTKDKAREEESGDIEEDEAEQTVGGKSSLLENNFVTGTFEPWQHQWQLDRPIDGPYIMAPFNRFRTLGQYQSVCCQQTNVETSPVDSNDLSYLESHFVPGLTSFPMESCPEFLNCYALQPNSLDININTASEADQAEPPLSADKDALDNGPHLRNSSTSIQSDLINHNISSFKSDAYVEQPPSNSALFSLISPSSPNIHSASSADPHIGLSPSKSLIFSSLVRSNDLPARTTEDL